VPVGNPGNAADTATNCVPLEPLDCGSVPYDYAISRYEVTNAQYAEFLNAVAASDPSGASSAAARSVAGCACSVAPPRADSPSKRRVLEV
jgi:formylglycine-generating enzyme required for sulfatase activity